MLRRVRIRIAWMIAGVCAYWLAQWAAARRRSSRGSVDRYGIDPETGLRLQLTLTPAELADARRRESETVLLG